MKMLQSTLIVLCLLSFAACGGGGATGWDGTEPSNEVETFAKDACDCLTEVMKKAGIDISEALDLGRKLQGNRNEVVSLFDDKEKAAEWEGKLGKVEDLSRETPCYEELGKREQTLELRDKFKAYSEAHCIISNLMR